MTQYWFKPKRYGYGATPVSWEGWAATIAVSAVVIGSVIVMQMLVDRSNFVAWVVRAAIIAAVTLWFVRTARERTDGEWRWRWGNRSGTTKT
jgi:Na+/melibiose symporter-like transporter